MNAQTVLVVDDERNIRRSLDMVLSGAGYTVVCASSAEEAVQKLGTGPIHVALVDIVMPGMSGIDLLQKMREDHSGVSVIMISGHGTVRDAVRATKLGAYDFLEKPLSLDRVRLAVSRALQAAVLAEENRTLRQEVAGRFEMIGQSEKIEAVREQINRVAPSNGRVLILGESGTGKELIARALHSDSARNQRPFVKVNCAAIPEELIESELFGSDRGAFTGAVKTRDGKFLLAEGGTLFLDEIGDMSFGVQAKVLRALEQGEFERVGGSVTIKVDVRVIAATNKNLLKLVEEGQFREDLFFRLNVVPIIAPSLRERREDIPCLVSHFLNIYADENGFRPKRMAADAIDVLCRYDWPGNVRELKNLVERLSIMVAQDDIGVADLPALRGPVMARDVGKEGLTASLPIQQGKTLREVRESVEKAYIADVLQHSGWNVTRAARSLGIERTNLHKKIRLYEIGRQRGTAG